MKVLTLVPMGAALLVLGLGLSSAVPPRALARDEAQSGRVILRSADEDRDNDRDSDKDDSGYLGVQVQRLSASLRRAKGIPESTEGTLVSSVEDESPADEAGLKRGDVILSVDHQGTPNPADLVRVVRSLDPGHKVSVQVWRDGVTRSYTLKVGSRPEGSDMPMPMPPPSWGGRGNDDQQMPDGSRMQILRRNRDDIQRQIQELQTQVARLESEIHDLQQQLNRRDHDDHDRNRNDDRDRDRDRDNDGD